MDSKSTLKIVPAMLVICLAGFAQEEAHEGGDIDSFFDVHNYSGAVADRAALTGDWGGARTDMQEKGLTVVVITPLNYS